MIGKLLMVVPDWLLLMVVVVAVAAITGAGWHARGVYEDAQEKNRIEDRLTVLSVKVEAAALAGDAAAKAIGKIRVNNTTITNEVRHETQTKEIFRDARCDLPDSTFLLLNAALAGRARPDPVKPDGAVPAGAAPAR